jgi:hypothetical protein
LKAIVLLQGVYDEIDAAASHFGAQDHIEAKIGR